MELAAETLFVERGSHPSVGCEGNGPAFLGDDDNDAVRSLGDSETCSVTHSVVGWEWCFGEWQGATSGDDSVITYDDGTIV
jgi:hypothetical protein